MACAQLLADMHDSLGHCRQDKLLSALCGSYCRPGMHAEVADYIWHCSVCQWDKPPVLPKEELRWMDKGGAPFISWSINMAKPFPQDKDRNCYLLIAVDPFSKRWKSVPCPHYIVGGQPSSYMMTWLPIGASCTTSRPTMALSLRAALHGCAKVLVLSINTSPLATVRPMGR